MQQTLELMVTADHPELAQLRETLPQNTKSLAVTSAEDLEAALRVAAQGAPGKSATDWIILADASAPLLDADLASLSDNLQSASTAVWLQPWSRRFEPALYAWQTCGPRCASLWCNPSPALAVCLHRPTLQSALSQFETGEKFSPEATWQVLIRVVAQGHRVGFPDLPTVQPGIDCLESAHLPQLVPSLNKSSSSWLSQFILPLKPSQLVTAKRSDADAVALKAGICQWHGWLDESHQLSQSIEGLGANHAGDYWHAIMHRREPDYSNAKYWFRQLGRHAVFSQLASFVDSAFELAAADNGTWKQRLTSRGTWDPFAFVDFCEACAPDESSPLANAARRLQSVEMRLLLAATCRDAALAG